MKVTQEKLPDSQIALEIEISPEISQNTYETVVKKLARSTNIPGFRKGKIPRQILLQRLGIARIKAAALEEIIQDSVEKAIEQESIDSLGNYQLRSNFEELLQSYQPGASLTFSASLDVPPVVEIGDYQDLQIQAEEVVYQESQIDDLLEERRQQNATLVPVEDRPTQMGDVVVIDYQGKFTKEDGSQEPIQGAEAENFQVEMAEGKLIEGLIEGIVGMNPQETKEISATFPSDYAREDLAGQAAVFTITLKEIKEKELPELDDDFAQDVSEFETLAELRASLESQYQEKASRETKNNIHAALVAELVKLAKFDLPETMIQKEVDTMLTQTAVQMSNMGVDIKQLFNADTIPQMRERSRPEAIKNIKASLTLGEIAQRESINIGEEAIEAKVAEVKKQLAEREIDLDKLRQMVTEDLLKEATLDWLQEKATVELVPSGTLQQAEEESVTELQSAEAASES